jgi:enoyl-CoA hydratase
MEQALAVAQRIAGLPPQAVQSTKRALNMHIKRAVAGVLEYALSEEFDSFETVEHQTLVTNFLERSKARAAQAKSPS